MERFSSVRGNQIKSCMLKKGLFVLLVILLLASSCRSPIGSVGDELDGAPGLFTFTGSDNTFTPQFQKAADYMMNEKYVEAEQIYRGLIEKEPDNLDAHIGLGSSLIMQGRLEEAQAAYEVALDTAPGFAEALIGLGSVHNKKGEFSQASNYYSQALKQDERNPNAHWGMALSLNALGSKVEAIRHLERVIELAPGSSLAINAEEMIVEIQPQMDQGE